jgi:hypothetical protein
MHYINDNYGEFGTFFKLLFRLYFQVLERLLSSKKVSEVEKVFPTKKSIKA